MNHPFVQLVMCRFREFYREPVALFWVYAFPLLLALGLGMAFSNAAPKPPTIDVEDGPHAATLAKCLNDADVEAKIRSAKECKDRLKTGQTALIVSGSPEAIDYTYDPARSDAVLARHWADGVLVRGLRPGAPALQETAIHEPGSRYIDFLLPGLIGMNLMGGGLFGLGFNLVDMRVRKLFKRLVATPMRVEHLLASLLSARMIFLFPEMLSLLVVGTFLFGVPIHGSLAVLVLVIVTTAVAFSGIGLLIGSRTEKTETVSGLINLVALPMYIFSGVFFSPANYPAAMQPFIQALPLTQATEALRAVMLEGANLNAIAWRIGILAAWAAVTFALALKLFRWR